jgi:hypothetical protein
MKLSKLQAMIFSGVIWLGIGVWLLTLGLSLIGQSLQQAMMSKNIFDPFLAFVASYVGGADRAGVVIVAVGLLIGYFKGRFVLAKTVQRISRRVATFGSHVPVSKLYSKGYLLLIASMIVLGMSIKWLGLPFSLRGFVDTAIGSALINGSLLFFREAIQSKAVKA